MMRKARLVISGIAIPVDLDDTNASTTVQEIINIMPISTVIHVWGEELYTDGIPIDAKLENPKSLVSPMDVAYWPPGNALCFFFGPTPLSQNGEIKPYSPVTVIGKINPEMPFPKIAEGSKAKFEIIS
ncbi:MAG: cyclophilin-like family protein [Nitrososphaera sp.]|jgi:hypothetical protein